MNLLKQSTTLQYARTRRLLGICYVGTIVVISAVTLYLQLPTRLLGQEDRSWTDFLVHVAAFTSFISFLSLPFDLIGLRIEKVSEVRNPGSTNILRLFQGIVTYSLLFLSLTSLFAMATHYFGFTGVALYSVGTLFVLILAQLHVAAAVGAFRFKKINPNVDNFVLKNGGDDTSPLLVIHNRDNGATGGLIGFPFQESLALPSSWLDEFTKKEIRAGLARRRLISKKGYRATGLTSAAVFVFVGTLLSALLTVCVFKCRLDASSGVITHSLIFTQWSLIGLLSLSYPNQLAVFFCDEAALQSGGNKPDLTKFIEKLDGLTEPEPQRSGSAQLIFHPIPNFERRMKNTEAKLGLVPWNVARYAIYLSVSGLGLLGRAVHCNAGRPELWIMLPCD